MPVPHHPRRFALSMQILQLLHLFECIHAGPKAVVSKGKEPTRRNKSAERFLYQFLAFSQVLKDFPSQYKEPSVDACSRSANMLNALYHASLINRDHVETGFWFNTDKAGQALAFQELVDYGVEVHVRQTIGVVGKERLLILDVLLHHFQAHSNVRVETGIDEGDAPIVDIAVQQFEVFAAAGKHEIIRDAFVVVQEVILDHNCLIT